MVIINKLILLAYSLVLIFPFNTLQAKEIVLFTIDELQEMRANAHCSVSEKLYQQCFDMNLEECSSVYQTIFSTCDQLESDAFFDFSDQSAVDQFNECYQAEFDKYIESKGINLDEECEF